MKAIILISSIFFLLGLKISNKVDLVKKGNLAPVVTNKLDCPEKQDPKAACFQEDAKKQTDLKITSDSSNTRTSVIKFK